MVDAMPFKLNIKQIFKKKSYLQSNLIVDTMLCFPFMEGVSSASVTV